MTAHDTKERILDAAEALFADQGFDATSLRAITAQAGVNLAAVNYHFGSKEILVERVLARRLEPLNSERLSLLDRVLDRPGGPTLEQVLECFYGPTLRMAAAEDTGSRRFMQMFGRTFTEPGGRLRELFAAQFREVASRFGEALHGCLPGLPRGELAWRMHFMVGALAHTVSSPHALRVIAPSLDVEPLDSDRVLDRLVQFAAAGLRAPALDRAGKEKR